MHIGILLTSRYIIQTGGNGREWLLLIGSGIDGRGGALLLYRSDHLSSGTSFRIAVMGVEILG